MQGLVFVTQFIGRHVHILAEVAGFDTPAVEEAAQLALFAAQALSGQQQQLARKKRLLAGVQGKRRQFYGQGQCFHGFGVFLLMRTGAKVLPFFDKKVPFFANGAFE